MENGFSRSAFFVLLLTMFLTLAGFGIVVPVLPYFAQELGGTSFQLGLMVSLYALAQFVFAPLWGQLSDRIGRKPVLVAGLLGFSLSFAAMAFARSMTALILIRFLGGMLSSSTFPAAQALVADLTPPEQRTGALSMMGGAVNLGFMLGPLLGIPLTRLGYGFHTLALAGAGAILVTALLALLVLPATRPRSATQRRRMPLPSALRLAIASREAPCYWLVLVQAMAASNVFSMLGLYLMERMNAPEGITQTAFAVMGISSAVMQFTMVGRIIDRWGEMRVSSTGFLTGALAFILLLASTRPWQALVAIGVWGMSTAMMRPPLTSLVSRRTVLGQGTALGLQSSFESMGRMVGPLIAGALFDWHLMAPYGLEAVVLLTAFAVGRKYLLRLEPLPEGPVGEAGGSPAALPATAGRRDLGAPAPGPAPATGASAQPAPGAVGLPTARPPMAHSGGVTASTTPPALTSRESRDP